LVYIFKGTNTYRIMAKKLYVGGLPYSTSDTELKEAFAQVGAVESAVIIMDKMSGRSKGFGFVEMSSDEDAQKAIEMWNGKDFGGRTLTVNEARPMEERPRNNFRGNDRGGYGGGRGNGGGGGGGRNW
jgi:RNA recognition motif-containing protein